MGKRLLFWVGFLTPPALVGAISALYAFVPDAGRVFAYSIMTGSFVFMCFCFGKIAALYADDRK